MSNPARLPQQMWVITLNDTANDHGPDEVGIVFPGQSEAEATQNAEDYLDDNDVPDTVFVWEVSPLPSLVAEELR